MSLKKLYAIKDHKAQFFLQPAAFRNDGEAKRLFVELMLGDNNISKYPEDYSSYCVGEYDETTGVITPCVPDLVLSGKDAHAYAMEHLERQRRQALEMQNVKIEEEK